MIRVNDDFVIDVDQYNYTAMRDRHKTTVDKDGNESPVYTTIGHYNNLEHALYGIRNWISTNKLSEKDSNLIEAINIIRQTNDEFINVFNRAIGE